jgi:2'-5' RNA ligase
MAAKPSKKLFFALWPDDISRQRCLGVLNTIGYKQAKPVLPNNLHVTLVFLGYVSVEKETGLLAGAATIPVPELSLCFDRISFWKKPGIICLTSTEINPELSVLVAELSILAEKLGIRLDPRTYKPHVTLVRKAVAVKSLDFEPVIWRANGFCLVESVKLEEGGVEYRVVERWSVQ